MKLFLWPLCQNKKNTKLPKAISDSKVSKKNSPSENKYYLLTPTHQSAATKEK